MLHRVLIVISLVCLSWPSIAHEEEAARPARPGEFLKGYRPNYFLYGPSGSEGDDCDIKFQLSLKQRLAPEKLKDAPLRHFYFGYTQQSWWDICEESAPFRESQFNPEFFWVRDFDPDGERESLIRQLQIGAEHNSNGRDGDNSRSWNRLYGQLRMAIGRNAPHSFVPWARDSKSCEGCFVEPNTFGARLKVWYIIDSADENNDIEDYLGHADATIQFTSEREQFSLTGWVGDDGKVSAEFNYVAKSLVILNWIPGLNKVFPNEKNTYYWHFQYFNGYGDELVRYDDRDKVARFGVMFNPQVLPN